MKNILFSIIIIVSAALLFPGCEKLVGFDPEFTCDINPNPAVADELVAFTIEGYADRFAIYTGDPGHTYKNSFEVVTEGKVIDKEELYLPEDSLAAIVATGLYPVEATNLLKGIVNQVYISKIQARTSMNILLQDTTLYTDLALYQMTGEFLDYFVTDYGFLEPEEGWSTGFNIDIGDKRLEYIYKTPGTYTVTVIGTTVGEKKYKGSGYKKERIFSADEYDLNRVVKEYTITVD